MTVQPEASSDWRGRPRRISPQKFSKEPVFRLFIFQVNCISFVLFILLSGAEWTEWYSVHSENGVAPKRLTNTVYSKYSYAGIVSKESALSWKVVQAFNLPLALWNSPNSRPWPFEREICSDYDCVKHFVGYVLEEAVLLEIRWNG